MLEGGVQGPEHIPGGPTAPTQCPWLPLRPCHPPHTHSPILESKDLSLLPSDCPERGPGSQLVFAFSTPVPSRSTLSTPPPLLCHKLGERF